jgi:hypothetical protein
LDALANQPQNAAGYYEGTADSKQAGKLQVSLNLRLTEGRYEGLLITPVGNFTLKSATLKGSEINLQFDADGATGSLDGRFDGATLNGSFNFGDDSGSMSLRRLGSAKAPAPKSASLNIGKQQWLEDVRFFAREITRRHANAFHHTAKEKFDAEVAELDASWSD